MTTWQEEPQRCELCGQTRAGYEGPFYGLRDCEFVCEDCLVQGRLQEAGLWTNEGDVGALNGQLASLDDLQRARVIRGLTDELRFRTPHLVSWQDWPWPACCGDYLRFEGELGREELAQLAGGGDAWQWMLDHVREALPEGMALSDLAPRASNSPAQWSLVVYHFRCLLCGTSSLRWDCD